jgi:isoleucyl-tRNA synthetase
LGNPIANLENRRQTGGSFNRFDRRVIQRNRKVNSGRIPKKKILLKDSKWNEANYDLIDLHKNVVDEITLVSASGKPMKREADLIDVWFDSGSMPYAQWHYFENKDKIDANKDFPGDFIAEGVDQTRGWFYTLHDCDFFDKVAYKKCSFKWTSSG